MNIREAREDDFQEIARISSVLGYEEVPVGVFHSRLNEILDSPDCKVWVCVIDKSVLAWIHAIKTHRLTSDPFIEIVGLAVDPAQQRSGIGSSLVNRVIDWASSASCHIRVRTNEKRLTAINFYEKCGFVKLKNQMVFQRLT
jgi:GNAT superfamily N-acetyltransferase